MALIARRSLVLLQVVLLAAMLVAPAVVRAVDPAPTSTTIVSSLNPSVRGLAVTFTATVTIDGASPATVGTVKFGRGSSCTAGFTQLQAARAVDAAGLVTYTTVDIAIGTTRIWACYEGVADQTLNSDASLEQVIAASAVPTTMTVTSASGPFGGTADLAATLTVTSTGGAVAGVAVSFTLAGTPVGVATTDAAGTAALADVSLAGIQSGDYPSGIGASFAGNAARAASSGTAALTVGPAGEELTPTSTTVTCAAGPFVYTGSPVTPCSVAVTAADGLSLAPEPLYADNVAAGTATASYAYPGDASHQPSSGSATFEIGQATLLVDALAGSKTYGDPDPGFGWTLSGFVGDEDASSAGLTGTADCSREPGEAVVEGPYAITCTPGTLAAPNYGLETGATAPFTIEPAPSVVTIECPAEVVYTGSPVTPCTASVSGAGGLSEDLDVAYADNILGTATATATYPGDDNHVGDSAVAHFVIAFGWGGYLQPINDTRSNPGLGESRFRLGRTIPVKFRLVDASGAVVIQATNPTFGHSGNLGSCDADTAAEPPLDVEPTGGSDYTWNGSHYQFNWSTKGLTAGEYRVYATLADGTRRSVDVCLRG